MRTRTVTTEQRRRWSTRRHHLAGDATSPEQVVGSLVALHATDPATMFVSVLVRAADVSLTDVLDALFVRRTLVRWMAMRRTLFVLPVESVPMVQAAASAGVAANLRRDLVKHLEQAGSEPPIDGDVAAWLDDVERRVSAELSARGAASAVELSAAEPRLRTSILPRAGSDVPQNVTTRLLTLMGAEARMVRGTLTGGWNVRRYRWEPVERWWPDGVRAVDRAEAQEALARAWLGAFGPAPMTDLVWWTGWTKTVTRAALARLDAAGSLTEVDLDGQPAIGLVEQLDADLATDREPATGADGPVLTLLPALDSTPMGWKQRDWFLAVDPAEIFDRNGNIGPTVWWDGQIVGGWGMAGTGEIRVRVLADRGAEVAEAAERAAAALHPRLDGAVIAPSFRTPLERSLTGPPGSG